MTPAWPEVAWCGSWGWDRSEATVRGRGLPCHGQRWAQFSTALAIRRAMSTRAILVARWRPRGGRCGRSALGRRGGAPREAASMSAQRSSRGPHLARPPRWSVSPDWETGGAQALFDLGDLVAQLVDEPQGRLDVTSPGLFELEAIEQLAAADAEEVRDRTGVAEGHEAGVDPVLESRAVLDEMEAEAGPYTISAHGRVGQPDRRHEVAPGELGQHPGVDAIFLQASGASLFTFLASATSSDQPHSSKVSWTNRAPFIDSMTASTSSVPQSPSTWRTKERSPSRSGGAVVTLSVEPSSDMTRTSRRCRDRSSPACNMVVWPLLVAGFSVTTTPSPGAPLHAIRIRVPSAHSRPDRTSLLTNVAFSDAQQLLVALGFDELRVRGSHHVYSRSGLPEQLNLQDRGGQAKPYQLRQLVALVRRYDLRIEEDE